MGPKSAVVVSQLASLLVAVVPAMAEESSGLTIEADGPGAPILPALVNGVPLRLEVDPSGPRFLILDGDAAKKAGLRANRLLPVSAKIEGVKIEGRTGRTGVEIAGAGSFRIRTIWFPGEEYSAAADGKIGIGGLTQLGPVTLVLGDGGRDAARRRMEGDQALTWTVSADEDGLPLAVSFDLSDGVTTTSAAGMARLAAAGRVTDRMDAVALEPFELGLEKLARREDVLSLSPLGLRPARIRSFLTREDLGRLQDKAAWEARFEGQDVFVVSAKTKRGAPIPLTLGRDALDGCRSLTFDPADGSVTLACATFAEGE